MININRLLPQLLIDFCSTELILTTVIGEFLTCPSYNKHLAIVLYKVFFFFLTKLNIMKFLQ